MPDPTDARILAVIIGMALINFALRFVPLAVLSRVSFPRPIMRWLSFVPISVMGALVATEVVGAAGASGPLITSPSLYAAGLTMLVFRLTRSFLGATVAGMVAYVVLGALLA